MSRFNRRFALLLSLALLSSQVPHKLFAQDTKPAAKQAKQKNSDDSKKENDKPLPKEQIKNPVLWHDPGDISSLDLFHGQGGTKSLPTAPFIFLDEDRGGTNPKFDVRDANGKKWHCKVGDEARPEVVASRLLWAMGYFANDDYLVATADVSGMKMHRGSSDEKKGHITNARCSRKPSGQDKIGIWEWKDNPFYGTQEFNGLRVMMALMNNWDLKDVNNSVYQDKKKGRQIFLINDVGATFGTNGLSWTKARSKGNVDSFRDSEFIQKVTDTTVSFGTPKRPTAMLIETAGVGAKDFAYRTGLDWIGNDIPLADARWIGKMLGQLTHQQIVDAFRAGNWPPDELNEYVRLVEDRIAKLKAL